MNIYDLNYKYTIQKIATNVMQGYYTGKDPFQEIVKAAEQHQLTPDLIESAVHHINNELILDHLNKNASGSFSKIQTSDVLNALAKDIEEQKLATDNSYLKDPWNLKEVNIKHTKTASLEIEPTDEYKNIKKSHETRTDYVKKAMDRTAKRKLYDDSIKIACELKQMKVKIANEISLALKRNELSSEEVLALAKVANDRDLAEVYTNTLKKTLSIREGRKVQINQTKFEKFASKLENGDSNKDSVHIKSMQMFLKKKEQLDNIINEYDNTGEKNEK